MGCRGGPRNSSVGGGGGSGPEFFKGGGGPGRWEISYKKNLGGGG